MTFNPAPAFSHLPGRGQGFLLLALCWLFSLWASAGCAEPHAADDHGAAPSPVRSPEEEHATFQLAPGLQIELVASEPLVQDPVAITFDEDGRLWVVEMRGFMADIDGEGEDAPTGRISVLRDTDGDGQMDTGTIFLDSLVLPRTLAVVRGGALVAEHKPLWFAADADGDLRAERKMLIDSEYGGSGLPEHSGNGLWRGLDNWYYNAKSRFRYRLLDGQWTREETEFRGQWGLSHDDAGRLYYNYNWSQLHADLVPPNYLARNVHHMPTSGIGVGVATDRRIYPIRPNRAVNRGYIPSSLDERGRLLEFTSASAPLIYRGSALPAPFYGNAFVCEPAGNLIKRNLVEEHDFSVTSRFAYPDAEFLASTDERFRPVFLATGPDGALYVADMYRGVIQHGAYMTPYLRQESLARDLVQPIHLGRIWRIVPESWTAPKPTRLSEASPDQLVALLSHPNGWHRDTAQRLLIERQDTAAIRALHALVRQGAAPLGRLHALWTLEGLGNWDAGILLGALKDPHPRIRATALRLLETVAQEDERVRAHVQAELVHRWEGALPDVVLQMALTAGALDRPTLLPVLTGIVERYGDHALIRDAVLSSLQDYEFTLLRRLWTSPTWQRHAQARAIFLEMLATATARHGDPTELADLLSMLDVDAADFGWREKAVLTGVEVSANDPARPRIRLAGAPAVLSRIEAFGASVQPQLRTVASLFEWPGHVAEERRAAPQTPLNDADQQRFAAGRQQYLTMCAGCHGTDGTGLKPYAPPLVGSEWVLGDELRLVRILLHGMEGPLDVKGRRYEAPEILVEMPSHAVLDDEALAAVATYIRHAWGHDADPVSPATVGRIRHTSQGRVMPWTAPELLNLPPVSKTDAEH